MDPSNLQSLVEELTGVTNENEWLEFKLNYHSHEEIGERLSALANGAAIENKTSGFLVFGIDDTSHKVLGTTFDPFKKKVKNEPLENWLAQRLDPRIDFKAYTFMYNGSLKVSLYIVPAAKDRPIEFKHEAYIRVGSVTRKLRDFPNKAAKIWRSNGTPFEKGLAKTGLSGSGVIELLSTETYFDLLGLPYPTRQEEVIKKLKDEKLVVENNGLAITNLGALLFAKNLKNFELLNRKAIRVIVYKGKNKVDTIREQIGVRGYALGFEGLVDWINSQLPANEEIGKVLREETRMYPDIAIRELVANALIHQDLSVKGFPMIEIYSDRIEISNPGKPLITTDRFIDSYQSRNDSLADLMRRMGFCEEKGSGLDKVIFYNELYQLPPIDVTANETRTKLTIYSYKKLTSLDRKEKIRACYQHACLKYVSNDKMTNKSLRERFKVDDKNYSIVSRIIKDALFEGVIKELDPTNKSRKYASYLPVWA